MDSYLHRLQVAIAAVVGDMSPADLSRRFENKWSAAEVLEHLYLTYISTGKAFQRCLQAGHPLATSPTLKQRIATAVTVSMGIMPGGREAPSFTQPRGTPPEKIVAEVEAQIAAMDAIISQCEDRFGKGVKLVNHHVLGPLSGEQWRKFHWVHGRHHLKQILQLRAAA